MQVTRLPDRADLAVAEKSGARERPEDFRERVRVVVGYAEKIPTAAVAGKDERGKGLTRARALALREIDEVVVRRELVAELVLQRLPGARAGPDRDRAGVGIRA